MKRFKLLLRGLVTLLIVLLPALLIAWLWGWDMPLYQVQRGFKNIVVIPLIVFVLASFFAGYWFVRGNE